RQGSPTVYWHVVPGGPHDEVAVEYWFLYVFNGFENWHEADWEQVTVLFDKKQQPLRAFYSEHGKGEVQRWAAAKPDGNHLVVFVARGSHANYFTADKHRVTLTCPRVLRNRCV